MKVAIVHDWLTGMRGGEKCLEVFCELFPDAAVFTLLHNKGSVSTLIEAMDIRTSFVQKLPQVKRHYRKYLPLFPTAVEQFNTEEFDVLLSTSHCVAKGVIPHPRAFHICYCHTPMRYVWSTYHDYFGGEKLHGLSKMKIPLFANYLRLWDVSSNNRVDEFIANSENVKKRIWRYYRRNAEVILPPVKTGNSYLSEKDEGYYLLVSAFAPYKRVDLAIQVFNKIKEKLIIIGTGQEEKRLKKMADKNIEFLGWISDDELRKYYANCRALIFPGEEDLGIVPLEAQCYGKPVIAFGTGGVLETVLGCWIFDQKKSLLTHTGIFFPEQTTEQLEEAIVQCSRKEFNPQFIRNHALRFDREIFKTKIKRFIEQKLDNR